MKRFTSLFVFMIFIFQGYIYAQKSVENQSVSDTVNRADPNGNKIGYWEEKAGEITYKGIYHASRKNGNWIGYYQNNVISGIEFYTNGVKDGIAISIDKRGKISQVEYYKNGLLHGQTSVFNQSGDSPVSQIFYENGKKNGLCRHYY